MFAVSSVDAAKLYYESFKKLQKDLEKPIKVATIFSFAPNEEQNAIGEIQDETFEPTALDSSSKEFLKSAIDDYNFYLKLIMVLMANLFKTIIETCLNE